MKSLIIIVFIIVSHTFGQDTTFVQLPSSDMGSMFSVTYEFPFEPEEGFFTFVDIPDWLNVDIIGIYELLFIGIPPYSGQEYPDPLTYEVIVEYGTWGYGFPWVFTIETWPSGCTDPEAFNYDSESTTQGDCEYVSCLGCTDSEALNYNPYIFNDDGDCIYEPSCYDYSGIYFGNCGSHRGYGYTGCNCQPLIGCQEMQGDDGVGYWDMIFDTLEECNSYCDLPNNNYYQLQIPHQTSHQIITIEGTIISLQLGDEIGIFDLNGYIDDECTQGETLVSAGVWNGCESVLVAVGGRCITSLERAGYDYAAHNPINIRVYRPTTGMEYETNLTFSNSSGEFGIEDPVISDIHLYNCDTFGDANGDGEVNVLDIVCLICPLINPSSCGETDCNGDINGDGNINVSDIVTIVGIILDLS